MKVDNKEKIKMKIYKMDVDNLFSWREYWEEKEVDLFYLWDEDVVVIGFLCKNLFVVKGLIG